MEIKKIYTDKAPEAVGPYSQAIVCNGLVYTSGQIAINPETNTVEADDIKGQTEQIMKNLGEVLKSANSSFENAIKTDTIKAPAAILFLPAKYSALTDANDAAVCPDGKE